MRRVVFVLVNFLAQFAILLFVYEMTKENRVAQGIIGLAMLALTLFLFLTLRRRRRNSAGLR